MNKSLLYLFGFLLFVLTTCQASAVDSAEDCLGEQKQPCRFEDFVSEITDAPGLHVACLSEKNNMFSLSGYKNGYFGNGKQSSVFQANSIQDLRENIEDLFQLEDKYRDKNNRANVDRFALQPWRMFTSEGLVINSVEDALNSHLILIYEGGQFIWPGVRPGFRRKAQHISGKPDGIEIETVSLKPLVVAIYNFLEDGECDRIHEESEIHMKASPVAHKDNDVGKPATEWRTSTQHWLLSTGKPWLQAIDKRVEDLTRIDASHQEHVQVLRYQPGQKYDAHHDFFDIASYQTNEDIKKMLHYGTKNRLATVFWYLTDVSEGGSTWFPRGNRTPQPGLPGGAKSFSSCEDGVGIHSYPQKGKVIIFYSLYPNGEGDEDSLHAGCPPRSEDEKWSANKWVWNKPQSS